ncbi:zinc metalloprotease [Chelatococcus reniformis]|uniref:Zinc metalloprotease n=2 Tax=Chelatococcus reniformis TaxID=1494448 RepID=A0A916UEY2_9HYPH|nr:zinc metalloprotease [Chelatococcus reniformis]
MVRTGESLPLIIASFVFVLGVVVFIHEMGHFLVGRWCGVDIDTFSIGFGKELVGWTDRHGTRWRLAAIPLGGYVKFAGDATGASTPDHDALERMTPRERAGSFHFKSVWQRAAIVAAGPIANFLLAIVIFAGTVYLYGRTVIPPRAAAVMQESAAAKAGFEVGDLILTIDGAAVRSFGDVQRIVSLRGGEALTFVVDRAGRQVTLEATPELKERDTPLGKQRMGMLGLTAPTAPGDIKLERYGLFPSIGIGVGETWSVIEQSVDGIGKIIGGRASADQLAGPIGIAQVSGQVARLGFVPLLSFVAFLSVSIGLLNLLPVPLLDGGHLLFYAIEALRGRPVSERTQEFGFRIGLALVIMLTVFVTWNDIVRRILGVT